MYIIDIQEQYGRVVLLTKEQLIDAIQETKNGSTEHHSNLWEYYFPLCYNIAFSKLRDEELALECQVELTNHLIGEGGAVYTFDPSKGNIHSFNKTLISNWLRNWERDTISNRPDILPIEEMSEEEFEALEGINAHPSPEEGTVNEDLLNTFADTLPTFERKVFTKIRDGFDLTDICSSFGLNRSTGKHYYYLLRRKAHKFAAKNN